MQLPVESCDKFLPYYGWFVVDAGHRMEDEEVFLETCDKETEIGFHNTGKCFANGQSYRGISSNF